MKDAADREVRIGEMRAIGQHIEALDVRVREKENGPAATCCAACPTCPTPTSRTAPTRRTTSSCGRSARPAALRLRAASALGPGTGARHPGLRARRQAHRLALLRAERRRGAPAAGADRLDARPAHPPGLPGEVHALHGAPGDALRRRPAAEVPRQPVPRRRRGPVDGPDGRGAADRPAHGRDPRRRHPAPKVHRLHPLLPAREDVGRARCARHQARPPVRQGRDVHLLRAGGLGRRARTHAGARRANVRRARASPTASSSCAPATWASRPARPTTSKCGRRAATSGSRSHRSRTAATSRRGAPMPATGPSLEPSRSTCTRSTVRGWGCRAR